MSVLQIVTLGAPWAVLACLAAIVVLVRVNEQQAKRLGDARRLAAELMTERDQAIAAHNRIWWEGYYEADRVWTSKPLYQEGYAKARQDFTAGACEMQLVRESGELTSKVLG